MIKYLKDKGPRVGIKTSITGNEFRIVTMMFVDDGSFKTLGKRTYSQWYEVLKQQKRTVDDCSGLLRVSVGSMNPEK